MQTSRFFLFACAYKAPDAFSDGLRPSDNCVVTDALSRVTARAYPETFFGSSVKRIL